MYINNNSLGFELRTTSGTTDIVMGSVPNNIFTHVTVTYDGSQMAWYVNGALVGTVPKTGNIVSNSGDLKIGQFAVGGLSPFDGLIDEVEIFTRALTQAEIQAIVAADSAGKCVPGGRAGGDVVISEFRWDGPGGTATAQANNEFIELYNNTNSAITVSAPDNSGGWAVAADDATGTRYVIPNGTVIPARGHFLITNTNGYSLTNYPAGGGTTATPDGTYATDIAANTGIALFNTANPANFSVARRLDAVGTAGGQNLCLGSTVPASSALYREGAGLAVYGSSFANLEYSLLRDLAGGKPKDTDNNAADFRLVETTARFDLCGQNLAVTLRGQLGAPGPENLASPIDRSAQMPLTLVAPCVSSASPPNRVRDLTSDPGNNSQFGTLKIRRTVTNNTGASVTRLRFRAINITAGPAPSGTADLRIRSSTDDTFTNTCAGGATASQGLTLEQPPNQPNGGGLNSSLSLAGVTTAPVANKVTIGSEDNPVSLGAPTTNDTITLGAPLANGSSLTVNFLLGIQQTGAFRFYVIVEALP